MAAAQERGCDFLPVVAYTDCRDFYELTTGKQNVPQDTSQRVYILCHREARVVGRLRWTILIPTQCMLADALTKVMVAKQLLGLLTSGLVNFKNEDGHPTEGRRLPPQVDFNEGDLEEGDQKWLTNLVTIKEIKSIPNFTTSQRMSSSSSTPRTTSTNLWLIAFMYMAMKVVAHDGQCQTDGVSQRPEHRGTTVQIVVFSVMTTLLLGLLTASCFLWKNMQKLTAFVELETERIAQGTHPLSIRKLSIENAHEEMFDDFNTGVETLNYHARAMDSDIQNVLRRRAPPHRDEPSASRPRLDWWTHVLLCLNLRAEWMIVMKNLTWRRTSLNVRSTMLR